ncbi:hypothetical protein AB0O28_01760 [Microbispora sp. NPDC088329]|uniref:hypothetical protein n=1 Tax=Microbispora sp. NPDC088329 TaxID=3154869 RepID=UPI003443F8E3
MIIYSAAAALAATLIAGPAVSADPAPSAGTSAGGAAPLAAAPPDTVVGNPGYGPTGPDYAPGYGSGYAPVAMPVAARPAAVMAPPSEPKQAVYHLKGKDGVRHDVVVVPISDDPSKPITLPDFGFQKFKVTDKPLAHHPRAHKFHGHAARQHHAVRGWGNKHRHGGKAHRRHR